MDVQEVYTGKKRYGFADNHILNQNQHIVYHYCNIDAFVNIISKKSIHMSDVRKSNDYEEIVGCLDIYKESLRYAVNQFIKYDNLFNGIITQTDIDLLVEEAINDEYLYYYVSCFSESGDLLSQWRGYADDGKGFAIGFDSNCLEKLNAFKNIRFGKANYGMKSSKSEIIKYITNKFNKIKTRSLTRELYESDYENAISDILMSFIRNAVYNKKEQFSEEREWRAVYYPLENIQSLYSRNRNSINLKYNHYCSRMIDIMQNSFNFGAFNVSGMNFYCKNSQLCSFVDLNFSKCVSDLVKEIVLGPKNKISDLDLKLFLLKNDIDLSNLKIYRSNISYM